MAHFNPKKDTGTWLGHDDHRNDALSTDIRVDVVERPRQVVLYDHKGWPLTNRRGVGFHQCKC